MEKITDKDIDKAIQIEGWMSKSELLWLAKNGKDKEVVIEVGAWMGRSSRALGDVTCGLVYSIDHFRGSKDEINSTHSKAKELDGDYVYLEFLKNNWDLILKGKIIPMRANNENIAKLFLGLGIRASMIFLDAGHSYEEVKKNIQDYLPLLEKGGLICGHDYVKGWDGVIRAVNEFFPNVKNDSGTSIWHTTI